MLQSRFKNRVGSDAEIAEQAPGTKTMAQDEDGQDVNDSPRAFGSGPTPEPLLDITVSCGEMTQYFFVISSSKHILLNRRSFEYVMASLYFEYI